MQCNFNFDFIIVLIRYYIYICIKQVWDEDEHGNWHLTASWKAHSGSVWKVTWAHPECGQVLATCSFDRTAAVWEEIGIIIHTCLDSN